jgi:hypothetical protein
MLATEPRPSISPAVTHAAEAARYALLRRLAPSMRHHLVVNLQPIGMIYEVMDRRLRAPQPDLANVHDSAHKINGFAKAALNSCLDVVGWLAPDENATCGVGDGVRECAGLLATSLSFRGYALRNEVDSVPGRVRRTAMRNLLTALLIHATDETPPPVDVVIRAAGESDGARITLSMEPGTGEKGFSTEAGYRALAWTDVQALAAAEGVELERLSPRRFSLRLPWIAEA